MGDVTRELLLSVETTYAADSAELDRLARNLRAELLDTALEDVQPVSAGPAPAGAKALDAFAWDALRLVLDPAMLGSVLNAVLSTLTSWIRRNEGTSLHLAAGDCEVELKGAMLDPAALQKMLETCLDAAGEDAAAADTEVTEDATAGDGPAQPQATPSITEPSDDAPGEGREATPEEDQAPAGPTPPDAAPQGEQAAPASESEAAGESPPPAGQAPPDSPAES